MNPYVVQFFSGVYTWPEFVLLVLAGGIVALLVSAISRQAYYSYRSHLVLEEIQRDVRKLVMLQTMREKPAEPQAGDQASRQARMPDEPPKV